MRRYSTLSDELALIAAAFKNAAGLHPERERERALFSLILLLALSALSLTDAAAAAQGGSHTLYGDFKVDESKVEGPKPISFDLILYDEGGGVVARQTIPNNGRYRFMNLANGWYNVAVEVEGSEVARVRVQVISPFKNDFRQDIMMEWRATAPVGARAAGAVAAAADYYKRTSANQSLFTKAGAALNKKRYHEAASLLLQVVGADAKDYQAWTELGTARLFQRNESEAEKAYLRAIAEKPSFLLASLDLGRLRMARQDYAGALEVLTKALELGPPSADASFLVGECYLQIKKGSKAVGYLNDAARLGRADAHLRLAALYHGAGMKDKAAAEYEQYLSKKPDDPERKRLQQYIAENKKH